MIALSLESALSFEVRVFESSPLNRHKSQTRMRCELVLSGSNDTDLSKILPGEDKEEVQLHPQSTFCKHVSLVYCSEYLIVGSVGSDANVRFPKVWNEKLEIALKFGIESWKLRLSLEISPEGVSGLSDNFKNDLLCWFDKEYKISYFPNGSSHRELR